jgi:hypothetical protein
MAHPAPSFAAVVPLHSQRAGPRTTAYCCSRQQHRLLRGKAWSRVAVPSGVATCVTHMALIYVLKRTCALMSALAASSASTHSTWPQLAAMCNGMFRCSLAACTSAPWRSSLRTTQPPPRCEAHHAACKPSSQDGLVCAGRLCFGRADGGGPTPKERGHYALEAFAEVRRVFRGGCGAHS